MKKQILTLMVSAAVFATSPVFGMNEEEENKRETQGLIQQKPEVSLNEQIKNVKASFVKKLEKYEELQREWEEVIKLPKSQSNGHVRSPLIVTSPHSRYVMREIPFEDDLSVINADEELSKITKKIQATQEIIQILTKCVDPTVNNF